MIEFVSVVPALTQSAPQRFRCHRASPYYRSLDRLIATVYNRKLAFTIRVFLKLLAVRRLCGTPKPRTCPSSKPYIVAGTTRH